MTRAASWLSRCTTGALPLLFPAAYRNIACLSPVLPKWVAGSDALNLVFASSIDCRADLGPSGLWENLGRTWRAAYKPLLG